MNYTISKSKFNGWMSKKIEEATETFFKEHESNILAEIKQFYTNKQAV